jgi:DNA repair exonuclease SbcCD ATPase subunit
MAGFFQKALSVFVEFDEEDKDSKPFPISKQTPASLDANSAKVQNQGEAEKFEKYFDGLFEQANFPGPDYYEFFKMMETLEAHIHDEKARLSATFASLSIQGLTKEVLVESANKYKVIIENDKANFEKALNEKLEAEVGQRQKELQEVEKKIVANSQQIQKLTKEITEYQSVIGKLKAKIAEEDDKLKNNNIGYQMASKAVSNKIISDIQKIQSTL